MKISISAIVATLALSGCGTVMTTPRAQMDMEDLGMYQIDCSRKEEQLEFLKAHLPTVKERTANAFAMTSIFGWVNSAHEGTFKEDRQFFNREQESTALILIQQLNQYCQDEVRPQHKQGCVHLDEDTTHGASNGTQCYKNGQKAPTQTRWEATVDN